ncbi:MAG: hypothetical protein CVV07_08065 [Gammaproteobacteria bacterium HGW-Gammaproteobacteria-11]|nr:MAG: hypothetical protein CVV07_08065 [Gammaproteobacteria bacterium HGW-Gammaproteobacteria-11]
MRKQTLALVASGLLLASGFAAATEITTGPLLNADGTPVTNTDEPKGKLSGYGGVALGVAVVGLAAAAASDSGGGSSSTTATNTTP